MGEGAQPVGPTAAQHPIAVSQSAPVWRRAALLMLLCAGLAVVARSVSVHAAALELLEACKAVIAMHPFAGPIAFIVLAAASAMLAFVSVAVIVPVATYAWGPLLTVGYLWLGWVLGGVLGFGLGRLVGRSLLVWLSPTAAQRLENLVRRDESLAIALLLQLSLPSELLGYALGSARYPWSSYLFVLAVGEAPYAMGAVLLGDSFVARRAGVLLVGGIVFASLIVLSFKLLGKRIAAVADPT